MSEIKIRTVGVGNVKGEVMVGNGIIALAENKEVGVIVRDNNVSLVGGIRELQSIVDKVCGVCWARDSEVLASGSVNEPVPSIIEVTCWTGKNRYAPRECCRRD